MRSIDNDFINDLLCGKLAYFYNRVKNDRKTLSLEIRNGYINIYYNGGNLLRITKNTKGYKLEFDAKYCKNKPDTGNYERLLNRDKYDISAFERDFDLMMREMDSWFREHEKAERDYQHQLLVNDPDIVDIEYQIKNEMRLDMLYFSKGKLYVVENKYGNGAIGGKSGIVKHYDDICRLLKDPEVLEEMLNSVCSITETKKALGLTDRVIKREDIKSIEVLFLMANYKPHGKALLNALDEIKGDVTPSFLLTPSNIHTIETDKAESVSELKARLSTIK